jgi:hypothetical protein
LPRDFARSRATEGFSAMTRDFDMIVKLLSKVALLATSRPTFYFKGEESVRGKSAWQASSSKKRHLSAQQAQIRAHSSSHSLSCGARKQANRIRVASTE